MNVEEQMEIILKGVAEIVAKEELREKLKKSMELNKPLTIKLGLDPTAPDIHLGHAVVLRKIKQMQDLGHQAIIIIGDFTGRIGDPSGKSKGRIQLSEDLVKENARTYVSQIVKILDPKKTTIRFNSEWLNQLDFRAALELASTISVARMLEREDFKNRYLNHTPIGIHEFFYPLMQGYDSLAIEADVEIGGTDQTFNILMGRHLQKYWKKEKQVALFMPLLEGLDGVEKMSKSLGNYIGVAESARIMFKKVMEIPDSLIIKYFELTTDVMPKEITLLQHRLDESENPRDIKLELAEEITSLYHGKEQTDLAKLEFQQVFQKGKLPTEIPVLIIANGMIWEEALNKLIAEKIIKSKSEFKRILNQDGIKLNQMKMMPIDLEKVIKNNEILQIGKRKYVRFLVEN